MINAPYESNINTVGEEHVSSKNIHFGTVIDEDMK